MDTPSLSARRRLVAEFRAHPRTIVAVVFLGLVISAIQPACVKMTQLIIDTLQTSQQKAFPFWLPLGLVSLFVISGIAKYLYNIIRRGLCERVLVRFREALFDQYLHLPMSSLDRMRTGEMLSSIQNDLQQISVGFDTLWSVLKEPFTFLGLIGAAFYFDWRLTCFALLVVPVVAWLFSWSGAAVKHYTSRNLDQYSDLVSLSQEALVGSRVVKVFRLEAILARKFEVIQKKYLETSLRSIRVQELTTPTVELIGAALMAGVILYGAGRTSAGLTTAGDLVAFVIALGLSQMPIKQLNNAHLKMKAAEAAAERMYRLLDLKAPRPRRGISTARFEREIVYDGVGLEYDGHTALKNVSFELKAGKRLALVGQSGGGKTSIVNLLPRLYESTSGRILIDGKDIQTFELGDLRSLISYVTQDVFLFNDSIWENVRQARPEASDAEVRTALDQAHCTDFIARLSKGVETVIGDRGMRLSGGERQRIAIARAFLKSAPILILDEATSSLDSASESTVQAALDKLMAGKTSLIVAHRFSTIRNADLILVVEKGSIRERGTHESLVGSQGIYRGLFHEQTRSAPL
jgi:ATP-binding cassette, subfamily B, bacterial MsbA